MPLDKAIRYTSALNTYAAEDTMNEREMDNERTYFIGRNNTWEGPFSANEIELEFRIGELHADSWIYHKPSGRKLRVEALRQRFLRAGQRNNNSAGDNMSQWYVNMRGNVYGPFSKAQLRLLARSQRVTNETPVLRDGETKWLRLGSISGIIELQPPPNVSETAESPAGFWQFAVGVVHALKYSFTLIDSHLARLAEGEGSWIHWAFRGCFVFAFCSVTFIGVGLLTRFNNQTQLSSESAHEPITFGRVQTANGQSSPNGIAETSAPRMPVSNRPTDSIVLSLLKAHVDATIEPPISSYFVQFQIDSVKVNKTESLGQQRFKVHGLVSYTLRVNFRSTDEVGAFDATLARNANEWTLEDCYSPKFSHLSVIQSLQDPRLNE